MATVTVCVFAKPPRPGEVKTRLASVVGDGVAATLAEAFLIDTWRSLADLAWVQRILAVPRVSDWPPTVLADAEKWEQGDGDLGARLQKILSRALEQSAAAIALGADSPGLPPGHLEQARAALEHHDAVLGPAEDGGFYLIGLRRCPRGLLAELLWSRDDTRARTRARLEQWGLRTAEIQPWFDVDTARDLDQLDALLRQGRIVAPASEQALSRWRAGASVGR